VEGFPNQCCKRFATKEHAEKAYYMNMLQDSPILPESRTNGDRKADVTTNGVGKGEAHIGSGRLKDLIILVQFVVIAYLFFA